jgi:flagellar biogenesis protein FliO
MMAIPDAATSPELIPSLAGAALRMLAAVALLGAAAWALLRWQRRTGGAKRDLRVLDRTFLARGASLAVVSVADRRLLLGISSDGVRLITDLDAAAPAAGVPGFDAVLTDLAESPEDER